MSLVNDILGGPSPKGVNVGALFANTKKKYLKAKEQSLSDTGPTRFRVDFGFATVELIGNLINQITAIRSGIGETAEGLLGFDDDVAQLSYRYTRIYKPFYVNAASPEQWTLEDWIRYEDTIESPIFFWNIKDCRKHWPVKVDNEATHPCEGPDLHMALSLLHQSGVAAEFEREVVESLYGFMDLTLKDFTQFYSEVARDAAESITKGFHDVVEFVTPGRRFWTATTLVGVGAALYLAYKMTQDTEEANHGTIQAFRPAT